MIIIKHGHILTLPQIATFSEVQELRRLVTRGQTAVLHDCHEAFITEASGKSNQLVARSYAHGRHDMLMCAGGFLGEYHRHTNETYTTSLSSLSVVETLVADAQGSPAATRVPPELFSAIAGWVTATTKSWDADAFRKLAMLSMTCRYWNALYRPTMWQYVQLCSRDDLYEFASLVKSPPVAYCSIRLFVQSLVIRAVGGPPQPWIHLAPTALPSCLFPRLLDFTLDICMKQEGLGSQKRDYVTMHLTHDSLPKSLSAFNYQCNQLHLQGINFRRAASFLRFIRSFRYAETLQCYGIHWDDYPQQLQLYRPSQDPPLKRITVPAWPTEGAFGVAMSLQPGWVSVLWSSVRRRLRGKVDFFLEDDETQLAMRITTCFQGFYRRKHVPSLELNVRERFAANQGPTHSDGLDFLFKIDENIYELVLSLAASNFVTTPAPGPTGFSYRALHIDHVIISPRNRGHRAEVLEDMLEHEALSQLLLELPHLKKLLLAFEHGYKDELRKSFVDRWLSLRDAEKLVVARADSGSWDGACMWIEEDPMTLEPTGRSCRRFRDNDPGGLDNINGLSLLCDWA